jgi:hypothetical protein
MHSPQQDNQDVPEQAPQDGSVEVRLRRAPKFWPFVGTGAALGVFVAILSAFTGPESAEFTRNTVAGFLSVYFGLAGVLVGCVTYLVADRILSKRDRRTTAVPLDETEDR